VLPSNLKTAYRNSL